MASVVKPTKISSVVKHSKPLAPGLLGIVDPPTRPPSAELLGIGDPPAGPPPAEFSGIVNPPTCPPSAELLGRDAPPTHYLFKIESFSSLSKASIERYSSEKFDAGDYKWKLSIYPNGNKKENGQDHISMYLALVDTTSLPASWEVHAIFNFFVFDQVHDKYFSLKGGEVRRFHAMKTEWGISRFINHETFTDPSNGYLVDDACVFGAEIFILKRARKGECLSLLEEAVTYNYIWKIKSFSNFKSSCYDSDAFVVGDHKWRILLYPRGQAEGEGNSISVFLQLESSSLAPDTRLFVKFIMRISDQNIGQHSELTADNHFGPSCLTWGFRKFISLAKLNDPKKGFLVDDTCIIEAQVTLLGIVATVS